MVVLVLLILKVSSNPDDSMKGTSQKFLSQNKIMECLPDSHFLDNLKQRAPTLCLSF